jgi:hypothetical protein
MNIEGFNIRQAAIIDVPFLVDVIIEAEKSGTNVLSWSTIFGLSEDETKRYITEMLLEELDGCELSISSFLVAEKNGRVVAALSAWAEGQFNKSSSELKGDLLSFFLPKECIKKAYAIRSIIQEIHIDYTPGSIQKGAGYVIKEFRHRNLFGILTNEIIDRELKSYPGLSQVYTQIYGCNIPAIKANEKADFKIVMMKESTNKEILHYLPSGKKLVLRKDLIKK